MKKSFTKRIHGLDVMIHAQDELEIQVNTLFSILGTFPASEIVSEKRFEIGFNLFTLKQEADVFVIHSQDYHNNPFRDLTSDLTYSLWIQQEQVHLLKRLGIEGQSLRFDDKFIYAEGVFDAKPTYLERSVHDNPQDSGWFYGVREGDNTKLKACFAFQILQFDRSLIKYLALPFGYLVVLYEGHVQAILNEDNQDLLEGLDEVVEHGVVVSKI